MQDQDDTDPLYDQAVQLVLRYNRASLSLVQRHLRIGYGRVVKMFEEMERRGVVSSSPAEGELRQILMKDCPPVLTNAHPPRDPERIPKVLEALRQVWEQHPDLRLGQIVVIAGKPKVACPEIFYLEDDEFVKGLASLNAPAER